MSTLRQSGYRSQARWCQSCRSWNSVSSCIQKIGSVSHGVWFFNTQGTRDESDRCCFFGCACFVRILFRLPFFLCLCHYYFLGLFRRIFGDLLVGVRSLSVCWALLVEWLAVQIWSFKLDDLSALAFSFQYLDKFRGLIWSTACSWSCLNSSYL